MALNWPSVPLSELVEADRGITYGIVQPGGPVPDGIPIVRVTDIRNGRIDPGQPLRVSPDVARAYSRTRLRGGELLLTLVGTVGEAAIVPASLAGWNTARAVAVVPVRKNVGAYWVQIALRAPSVQALIKSRLNTTVQATLNLRDVAQLPIAFPPQGERDRIASILGALDDKIELNRGMSATLEAMARAIFKSWFVDFDPVRAKAEGRRPEGMDDATAALFPERFGEDGLPEGWRQEPLDKLAVFLNGLALQKYPPTGLNDLPVIKIAQLRAGSAEGADLSSDDVPAAYIIRDGDLLFSWSGSLMQRIWTGGTGALNQHLFKVKPINRSKWLCYLWVDHHLPDFQAIAASKATTMGHIQRHHLREALCALPPDNLLRQADKIVDPLFQRSMACSLESRTLAALRNTLLPALISGRVRVPSAERTIEAAVA